MFLKIISFEASQFEEPIFMEIQDEKRNEIAFSSIPEIE